MGGKEKSRDGRVHVMDPSVGYVSKKFHDSVSEDWDVEEAGDFMRFSRVPWESLYISIGSRMESRFPRAVIRFIDELCFLSNLRKL